MLGRTLTGLVSLVLLSFSACKADTDSGGTGIPKSDAPETFAKELCAAYYDCDCPDTIDGSPFTSQENCEADLQAAIQADIDRADDAELFYDSGCARKALDYFEGLECDAPGDLPLEDLSVVYEGIGCKVFYGTDEIGESCEEINNNADDTCVQDATCDMGTCKPIESLPDPGESCDTPFSLCSEGAVCLDINGQTNNKCEFLPDVGGTCLGTLDLCGLGLTCNQGTKTCEVAPAEGEACAPSGLSLCGDNLYCEADTCAPKPVGGEACNAFVPCAEGFACRNDVCVVEPAIVCAYTLGAR